MSSAVDAGGEAIVVGGGVVGLSIAWRLSEAGLAVVVVDPEPGRGASHVAAGMLAPVTEAAPGEEALVRLGVAAAERWPSFAREVEAASGRPSGYEATGTVAVGLDRGDLAELDELAALHERLGLTSRRLRSRELRAVEPLLAPGVAGGLLVEGDHQADPRVLLAALLAACERGGVRFVRRAAARVEGGAAGGAVVDLAGADDVGGADRLTADDVVVAAGARSGLLAGPVGAAVPVRPVKGQLVRLAARAGDARPSLVVRGVVEGRDVYVVPRASGEVVVGATSEEQGFDARVTAGAVRDLLDAACALVPCLAELELVEASVGHRPGSEGNAPVIGRLPGAPSVIVATGHHRNGVLLAPVTADAVAALVAGAGAAPAAAALVEPFAPRAAAGPDAVLAGAPVAVGASW